MDSLTDQIRKAIDAAPVSRRQIALAVDIDSPTMSRFMNRKNGLSLATLDRLAKVLGLAIVQTGKGTLKGKVKHGKRNQ